MYQAEGLLRGLFIWSVPMLALWWALRGARAEPMWSRTLELSSWLILTGSMVSFGVWLGEHLESDAGMDNTGQLGSMARAYGTRSGWYWLRPALLLVPACIFLFRRCRRSWWVAWALALLLTNPFDLFERFVIIITSLHRDYLPSGWTLLHAGYMHFVPPIALLLSAFVMLWAQRRAPGTKTNSFH